jgi:hypothetical protein
MEQGTKPVSVYLAKIAQRLAVFERSLPRQIDPAALSRSKLSFEALGYRETLGRRSSTQPAIPISRSIATPEGAVLRHDS